MERTCTKCGVPKVVETDFYKDRRGKYKHSAICKVCVDQRKKDWLGQPGNRERAAVGANRRYTEQKSDRKSYSLKKSYGIDLDWYHQKLKEQGGRCAICGTDRPGRSDIRRKYFSVDHDHVTRKPRGLLCINCNMVLGGVRDNYVLLNKAIDYLARYNNPEGSWI